MSPVIEKLFKHTERYSFRPIKKEVERTRTSSENLTDIIEEAKGPITSSEYNQSLRFTIQRLQQEKLKETKEIDAILPFEGLINKELRQQYETIIKTIEAKTKISVYHPKREFIDIESEELANQIENWTKTLIENLKAEKIKTNLSLDEVENEIYEYELGALSWFHFDSLINTLNAKSFEQDINKVLEASNYYTSETEEQAEIRNELLKDLTARAPLKKDEVEILLDLIVSPKDEDSLLKAMAKLWNQYELGKRKGLITKIMLSYFLAHTIHGITPFFFQYGIALPTVGLLVGNGVSAYFDLVGEVNEAKLMNDVKSKINKRISQSLIFNKYRFTHDRSLGQIIETLNRGKESTIKILSETMSLLLPKSIGIGSACVGLTLINPLLTLINMISIPITFLIGKAYNSKISPIHKDELKAKEKVANELASVKEGIETILTSPNTPKIERSVKDKMDEMDKLTLQRLLYETKLRYAAYFTFSTTQITSALSALALHWSGKISEGAVFSNVLYSEGVSDPFKEIVDKLCKEFPRLRENIKRMEKILGESDKLDLPDGEKEKNRISISELKNFNVAIRGLKFKNILKDIDLDIHEGDFITIAGPSGIGKSTLLKNIAGLDEPDSGSIKIGGDSGIKGVNTTDVKKYGDESIYSIMSYSNQDPYIFPEMTLRENIEFHSESSGDEYLEKLLDNLYLGKFKSSLGEKINHFSGGEQVRIGLARALFTKPKILLLDEPTRGLDSRSALEVKNILEKIHKEGTTIICVTHDEELIKYTSQQKRGKSINLSSPKKAALPRKTVA